MSAFDPAQTVRQTARLQEVAVQYSEEAWVSPTGVLRLIDAGEAISAAKALIGLALHSPALAPALEVALIAARSPDPLLRGNALLSFWSFGSALRWDSARTCLRIGRPRTC